MHLGACKNELGLTMTAAYFSSPMKLQSSSASAHSNLSPLRKA